MEEMTVNSFKHVISLPICAYKKLPLQTRKEVTVNSFKHVQNLVIKAATYWASQVRKRKKSKLSLVTAFAQLLTPSLPQPVRVWSWKVHTHTCKQ